MYCQKCGKEFQGNFCTNCGNKVGNYQQPTTKAKKPIYKKWWFWVLIVLFLIIIIPKEDSQNTSSNNPENNPSTNTSSSNSAITYSLSQAQKSFDDGKYESAYKKCIEMINKYPNDEKIEDAKSLLAKVTDAIPNVTATKIAQDYDENEVKADVEYKDKFLRITGTLESIGKVGNGTYITLSDGKAYSFSNPQFSITDEDQVLKVAEMKKGDKVNIFAVCTGATLKTPMFKNCIIE